MNTAFARATPSGSRPVSVTGTEPAETTCMAHIAISLGGHDWLEPVTDDDYHGSGDNGTV